MKTITKSILALTVTTLAGSLLAAERATPNIIVIMTDDQGYADAGFQGSKDLRTPHMDALAESGVVFTDAYVTYPVCGPSRAGFITGRYPQRFGFERNPQYRPDDPEMGLPLSEDTMADLLAKAGYTSAIIGKWHLGAHPDLHPLNRGFDFFYGHLGGGKHYFQEHLTIRDPMSIRNEGQSYRTWIQRDFEPEKFEGYLTDRFSDEAVRFIAENKEQPFFLFLSYNAPHTPMQAPEEYLERFPDIENPLRRIYAAMLSAVDDGVGRILAKLDDLELRENTMIFFLSDNGGPTDANASDNRPLRGYKSDVYDGGWRVPFVFSWPGTVEGGKRFHGITSAMDILGTAAAVIGLEIAEERPLDGVNLLPYLSGEKEGAPHEVIYLRKFDQQRFAVRQGDYKLVIPYREQSPHLFNLRRDIGETRDLADKHPDILAEIDRMRLSWDAELIEPRFLGLMHTEEWQRRMRQWREQEEESEN